MNLTHVLFSPNGRIGKQEFWIGILIIIAGNLIASFIPLLGFIISLGLIYVGVCVYGKRLHDAGRSAWIHALIWAVNLVLLIIGFIMVGGAILAMFSGAGGELSDAEMAGAIAASGGVFLVLGLNFLVWVVYTLWVGLSAGEPGENRFGPNPKGGADPSVFE